MEQMYDIIVPMTMDNLPVFRMNVKWIQKNLSCKRLIVIGAEKLRSYCDELKVDFIDEDCMYSGMCLEKIQGCIEKRLGYKKRAGWYFQQFIKLAYAYVCEDEYYIVWDADTVPLNRIQHIVAGHPVFTKKEEMEPAYFETLDTLFDGKVKRCGDFSFICENMVMNVSVMKKMLQEIMDHPGLQGDTFWERILNAVSDENLPGSGFSEFETYGNYVMTYYPDMYKLRTLRGMRNGAEFFGMAPTQEQLEWAAKSYDTIAFERWSHHHRFLGKICDNILIRKCIPLRFLVNVKKKVTEMRTKE